MCVTLWWIVHFQRLFIVSYQVKHGIKIFDKFKYWKEEHEGILCSYFPCKHCTKVQICGVSRHISYGITPNSLKIWAHLHSQNNLKMELPKYNIKLLHGNNNSVLIVVEFCHFYVILSVRLFVFCCHVFFPAFYLEVVFVFSLDCCFLFPLPSIKNHLLMWGTCKSISII